jgi:hypothetical protein
MLANALEQSKTDGKRAALRAIDVSLAGHGIN